MFSLELPAKVVINFYFYEFIQRKIVFLHQIIKKRLQSRKDKVEMKHTENEVRMFHDTSKYNDES